MNGPLCLRIPVTLLTLAAACVQDDAPAADFIISYEGVVPVANTGSPPPARLDPVVSIGPKTLTEMGSPDEFGNVSSVARRPAGRLLRPTGTDAAGRETVHRGSLRRSGWQALGRGRANGRQPLGGL